MIRQAFIQAQRLIFDRKGMLFLLFFINAAMAWMIVQPVAANFFGKIENSELLVKSFSDGVRIGMIGDFLRQHGDVLSTGFGYAILTAAFYMILQIFFTGGIFDALRNQQRFSFSSFFAASGRFFGRYLRLFLLAVPVLALLLIVNQLTLGNWLLGMGDDAAHDVAFRYTMLTGLSHMLIIWLWMIWFDYARVVLFEESRNSALRSFAGALKFYVRHPFAATGLFALNLAVALLITGFYWLLSALIGSGSLVTWLILLVVQQLFVLSRVWVRLSFLGSQLSLYRNMQIQQLSVEPAA